MIEIFETMSDIELALLIIGVFALILGIVLGYAMIHEYKMYLEEHRKARFSFFRFHQDGTFLYFLVLWNLIHHAGKSIIFLRIILDIPSCCM